MKSHGNVGVICTRCGHTEYFTHGELKAKTKYVCTRCGSTIDLGSAQKADAYFLRRYGLSGVHGIAE